jgi:aromatic ring-opening dioxygenase catalytic subunit (LigB family)
MCRVPYDFAGDPELARAIAAQGEAHGTWITAIDDHYLPIMYGTVNLWSYLGRPDKRWVSMSCCQTADVEDNLRAGRALGAAIETSDRRVLLVGSGAMSHLLPAAAASRSRGGRHRASSPRRRSRPTWSNWTGSPPATTPGCWRRCRSS